MKIKGEFLRSFVVILTLLTLTACASSRGFDRGNLRSQVSGQAVATEDDIKKALDLKPQLPKPFKLALYFTAPAERHFRYRGLWRWLAEDKDGLIELGKTFKDEYKVSEIFVINDSIVDGKDNKSVRLAAARAGADAVMIFNGIGEIDRYNNAAGYTYILLVTPFFIPGTEADALFVLNASMWDVRNQYLYLSVEAEGFANETRPAFFINEKRVLKLAKQNAIASLKKELEQRLSNTK